jgi:enoyl-CoA hydratase
MPDENLTIERDGAVAVLTVTRPAVLNALNDATVMELEGAVSRLAADDGVRAAILTGAGDKAFIAGADIRELAALTPVTAEALAARGHALCHAIERMGKPVIAAVNGYALGGGCELAMACTLRIAADTAKLGQPEIGLGLLPGYGGTQRLPRLIGAGRALEMVLTGAPIDAEEAWRIGLVNRVVPRADLMPRTLELAQRIAAQAPIAVRYILAAVREGLGMTLADGCAHEASLFGLAAATGDWSEGTRAFLEKRRPRFTGS